MQDVQHVVVGDDDPYEIGSFGQIADVSSEVKSYWQIAIANSLVVSVVTRAADGFSAVTLSFW